jgi:shikimate dehydrogenase
LIDASTRLCCLIGHPVGHSVSPQMHNAAFNALGLNYVYLAFDIPPEMLVDAVRGLRALCAAGFNVTIPHKVAVMKLLDELDPSAERTGAVNTVVNNHGALRGYNTDLHGIRRVLEGRDLPLSMPALVIGAGGAARAAVAALTDLGFRRILIANRTLERGLALVELARSLGTSAEALDLEEGRWRAIECGVVVNATPIGMYPDTGVTPLVAEEMRRGMIILDLVYNPPRTRLLEEAEKAGAVPISGLDVLVYQGAEAFRLWTNMDPPIEVMRRAVVKALEGYRRDDRR